MNRLTYKEPKGKWGIAGMNEENKDEKMYMVACKLKDYEDTGLMPDQVGNMIHELEDYKSIGLTLRQIKDLDQLYLEKCREVSDLRQQLHTMQMSVTEYKVNSDFRQYVDKYSNRARIDAGEALEHHTVRDAEEYYRTIRTTRISEGAEEKQEAPYPKVFAVDFDGTLCISKFPQIIAPRQDVIDKIKELKAAGHKIILWTCREGDNLTAAVRWCLERGLEFDAVNDALPEQKEQFNNETRKVWANYYIDDKTMKPEEIWNY